MIMDQLTELTSKGCGCLLVVDDEYHLIGTFTDGDLRRTLKASGPAIFSLTVGEMCNRFVSAQSLCIALSFLVEPGFGKLSGIILWKMVNWVITWLASFNKDIILLWHKEPFETR